MKRSIHAERVAHRNTLRLLCPDGHAPLTLSLAMTQLILHTHLNIPDSLGLASSEEFSQLLQMIFNRVPNIDNAIISVHCHNDLDKAVENSCIALNCGVRQIECAINGLGARKGNADLEAVVQEVANRENYQTNINTALISKAPNLVTEIKSERVRE
ncbi:MAG: hypothetical protein AAF316_05025 [Cyanobacteria bacterium P01_A01_bin.80]